MGLIGISLHVCVRDIAQERVQLKDVDYIIASTEARSHSDWDGIIDYNERYNQWGMSEIIVFDELLHRNLIRQPRLTSGNYPNLSGGVYWVERMSDIKWENGSMAIHDPHVFQIDTGRTNVYRYILASFDDWEEIAANLSEGEDIDTVVPLWSVVEAEGPWALTVLEGVKNAPR